MKIKRIVINNYRAFLVHNDNEKEFYKIDLPNGENLLLYGENGSGKSSLFRAMKDFLSSATHPELSFSKNIFYKEADNSEKPFISITLENGEEYFFSSDMNGTTSGTNPIIRQANITRGFISYKDLLKLHFREDDRPPNLFSFFLSGNGLIADETAVASLQASNRISFGELWEKINQHQDPTDIEDYDINALQKFLSLEEQTNKLLKFFEDDFSVKIRYTACSVERGVLVPPSIAFLPNLFGEVIGGHHDILNEARLTALAISVYLGHLLSLPVTDLRILFLDDIFTGLDMSNRLPLIEILKSPDLGNGVSFRGFQIFLTTYDREWFEIAKGYLKENWEKAEFYVDNHRQAQDRPFIRKTKTYEERAKYHFMCGDYPACANYMRKEFESLLKNILPENMLLAGDNGSSVPEDSLIILPKDRLSMSENDEAWFFRSKNQGVITGISTKFINLQGLIGKFKSLISQYGIPFREINELEAIKNRLLNPLSHDNLRSAIYKKELETGFDIIAKLKEIKSFYIFDLQQQDDIFLFLTYPDLDRNIYTYRIRLVENLRYFGYDTTGRLLNSACEIVSRFTPFVEDDFFAMQSFKSLKEVCKRIVQLSVPRNQTCPAIDENFVLNHIFTINNKPLQQMI